MKNALLIFLAIVVLAGLAWGATLDDIAKSVQQLQISVAKIESDLSNVKDGLRAEIANLRTIMITLFTALFAAMAGLFYFVLDISRSLRIPKEERVSKLEDFMEKTKENLREINEKLHMHKPIL